MAEQRYRELLPARSVAAAAAAAVENHSKPPKSALLNKADRRQAILVACEPCRKKKCKCDGKRPICGTCVARETDCIYDGEPDARRSVTLKRKNEALVEEVKRMRDLLELMRSKPQSEAVRIFQQVRSSSDVESIYKVTKQSNTTDPNSPLQKDGLKVEKTQESPLMIGDQDMQHLQAFFEGTSAVDKSEALSKLTPSLRRTL